MPNKATSNLRIGEFRQRVTLQSPTYNSPRDEITGWTPVATVWAAVEPAIVPLTGNRLEKQEADREISLNDTLVRIRFYSGVDTTWRVLHGSTAYDVRDVADVLKLGKVMHLTCRLVQ